MAGELHEGLEGIEVAATRLSHVDGERGLLVLAGHDVEELAARASFEDVVGLLWQGALPGAAERREWAQALAAGRERGAQAVAGLGGALAARDGMDALRAATAQLTVEAETAGELARLAGSLATFAAAWWRQRSGLDPLSPDASLGHAADYLRLCTGAWSPARAAALDAYLVTVADHGLNASTFVARVVASTGSDAVSAVVAALGALKGPLHGGAPGPVLDMLETIGEPDRAPAWLEAEIGAGRRIMGMGHRVYRTRDPRAFVLEQALLRLERSGEVRTHRLVLARAVEHSAERLLRERHPGRPLHANVEFYTAVLLDALGLPRELFTPTFAVGRVAGWLAHVREQRASGRLIRPASRYVGPMPAPIQV